MDRPCRWFMSQLSRKTYVAVKKYHRDSITAIVLKEHSTTFLTEIFALNVTRVSDIFDISPCRRTFLSICGWTPNAVTWKCSSITSYTWPLMSSKRKVLWPCCARHSRAGSLICLFPKLQFRLWAHQEGWLISESTTLGPSIHPRNTKCIQKRGII